MLSVGLSVSLVWVFLFFLLVWGVIDYFMHPGG